MPETFPAIIPIHLGKSTVYAIRDRGGTLLIDAGVPGQGGKIIRSLQKQKIHPEEVKLVAITHVHYDHVGSLADILRVFPCPVAVHENEAALLREGKSVLPAGTGAFGRFMMGLAQSMTRLAPELTRFRAVSPDVLISKETFLHAYGISGRILPTPGHTVGSLSILLDNGTAFVGDLAVNFYPWGGPIFPPFADDVPLLMKSWMALLAQPVRTIYPTHGKPFPVARLHRTYDKRMRP